LIKQAEGEIRAWNSSKEEIDFKEFLVLILVPKFQDIPKR